MVLCDPLWWTNAPLGGAWRPQFSGIPSPYMIAIMNPPRFMLVWLAIMSPCVAVSRYGAGTMIGLGSSSACVLLAALAPASCFFTGTKAVIPSRISPDAATSSSIRMAARAPIAWPDEITTTSLIDQPIRARIVAVAPAEANSPFNDRGTSVPWFEVRGVVMELWMV